ncbi:ubiquitin family protein [Microtetraspora malaysiensis]|uniref:Molybdopterin synthase sulfur carrier subunit n=1 Tax=Microtetraspora malaysiensis TaxID=161358 RepID=A0ABW6SUN1_9ACTN
MAKRVTLVTFVLPPPLRRWVNGQVEVRVFAVAASDNGFPTLGGALDTLRRAHPSLEERLRDEDGHLKRHITLYVCGANADGLGGLECALPSGAQVHVLPALV